MSLGTFHIQNISKFKVQIGQKNLNFGQLWTFLKFMVPKIRKINVLAGQTRLFFDEKSLESRRARMSIK